MKTLYVLFFIELGTRRVHISDVTSNPNRAWTTQEARQLVWKMEDGKNEFHFLHHDNDTKFTDKFDAVFCSDEACAYAVHDQLPVVLEETTSGPDNPQSLMELATLNEYKAYY